MLSRENDVGDMSFSGRFEHSNSTSSSTRKATSLSMLADVVTRVDSNSPSSLNSVSCVNGVSVSGNGGNEATNNININISSNMTSCFESAFSPDYISSPPTAVKKVEGLHQFFGQKKKIPVVKILNSSAKFTPIHSNDHFYTGNCLKIDPKSSIAVSSSSSSNNIPFSCIQVVPNVQLLNQDMNTIPTSSVSVRVQPLPTTQSNNTEHRSIYTIVPIGNGQSQRLSVEAINAQNHPLPLKRSLISPMTRNGYPPMPKLGLQAKEEFSAELHTESSEGEEEEEDNTKSATSASLSDTFQTNESYSSNLFDSRPSGHWHQHNNNDDEHLISQRKDANENEKSLEAKRMRKLAMKYIREINRSKGSGADRGKTECQCKICHKKFTANSSLIYHYRSHADVKPFVCLQCNAHFTRQHSLNYHMLIHKKVCRFQCHLCSRRFRHPTHFKNHLLKHTGEQPFFCHGCELKFSRKDQLRRHLSTAHDCVWRKDGLYTTTQDGTPIMLKANYTGTMEDQDPTIMQPKLSTIRKMFLNTPKAYPTSSIQPSAIKTTTTPTIGVTVSTSQSQTQPQAIIARPVAAIEFTQMMYDPKDKSNQTLTVPPLIKVLRGSNGVTSSSSSCASTTTLTRNTNTVRPVTSSSSFPQSQPTTFVRPCQSPTTAAELQLLVSPSYDATDETGPLIV